MISLMLCGAVFSAPIEGLTVGEVELVSGGFQFTEGPVWLPKGLLIFSDIPADAIYCADKSVFRKPSGKANGLTLDTEGLLIACEHGNRRVSRTQEDGTIVTVADAYDGKKLNSPNDVVVRSDGTIFFTDPPYGLEGRDAELPFSGVYAVAPSGNLLLLTKEFERPNGLAFSPDEKTLYIGDSGEGLIRAYEVAADGALNKGRLFCRVPGPDGMKVDVRGNLWTTAEDGVRVYDSAGDLLGTVAFPERPANCAFGDADSKTLYVTARTSLYKVRCSAAGLRPKGGAS
jgi:gluconolactonase